jgi:hypothetical protein
MTLPYKKGTTDALVALGLYKKAQIDTSKLENISRPNIINKFERLFTPELPSEDPNLKTQAEAAIAAERKYLSRRYNINPTLVGSLPLNLHIPNEVDLDFFVNVQSPAKFNSLVDRIKKNPRYYDSPYNKDQSGYYVFRRDAESEDDFPVDLAVGYGPDAKEYVNLQREKKKELASIPQDLRQQVIAKKHLLKNTPFDFKEKRYKAFKRELEDATGGLVRLKRKAHDDLLKQGALIDLNDPKHKKKFTSFINRKDVYGHRTHHIDQIAKDKHLLSAIDALRKGRLKSYEAGVSAGAHKQVTSVSLTTPQISELRRALLTDSPDIGVTARIAGEHNATAEEVKREYLKRDYAKIRKYLTSLPDGESFRQKHLSVPKLGPNIFLTKGGILDQEGYGDSAVLVRNLKATKSPFANLLTDEHIVKPKTVMTPRKVPIGKGYVLAPSNKAKSLAEKNPDLNIIDIEKIPEELKKQIIKPTRHYKEITSRWIPNIVSGDFSLTPTH